jgi:hypothetical protein
MELSQVLLQESRSFCKIMVTVQLPSKFTGKYYYCRPYLYTIPLVARIAPKYAPLFPYYSFHCFDKNP